MTQIFWPFERSLLKYARPFKPKHHPTSPQTPITIITGASEGIGRTLAEGCAELGLDLLLTARNENELEKLAAELKDQHGINVLTLALDLREQNQATRLIEVLDEHNLYPHMLINNAGVGLSGPFESHSPQDIESLIELNVTALTNLTRTILPEMKKRKIGFIINIASLGGLIPGPYQAAYYASKAYVVSLSLALAGETAFSGIRIAVVAPGPVRTKFHQKMGAEQSFYLHLPLALSPRRVARSSLIWFALHRGLIVPGLLNTINAILVRFIPNVILVTLMGVLLRRRA